MTERSPVGKVADTPENSARCICGDCPSSPPEGTLFCATGKSAEKITKRGCICPDCAVFKEQALVDGYYCAAGAAGDGPK
jgi:hypothetical protein